MISTKAYARDKKGALTAFMVDSDSYADAIADVRAATGASRALCLVIDAPITAEQRPNEEVAA